MNAPSTETLPTKWTSSPTCSSLTLLVSTTWALFLQKSMRRSCRKLRAITYRSEEILEGSVLRIASHTYLRHVTSLVFPH